MTLQRLLILGSCVLYCAAGATAFAQAGDAAPCIFPVFNNEEGQFLGMSLVNTGPGDSEATVQWTSAEGRTARTGRVTLSAGAQRAFLLREVLGSPLDTAEGWIRVDASRPGLLGYLTSGSDEAVDGVDCVSRPSEMIYFEHVSVNTGFTEVDHKESFVTLVNPGGSLANAQAHLIALDGRTAASVSVTVPPSGSLTIQVSERFGDALPENSLGGRRFEGYMTVTSSEALAGWLRIETPLSRRLSRGLASEEITPEPLVLAGHFAVGSALLYRSVLNVVNAGDARAAIDLIAQDDRGRRIGSEVHLELEPGEGIREDVIELFRIVLPAVFPPPLVTGYIRIRAASGTDVRLIGDVDIYTDMNRAAMLTPLIRKASRNWTMPFCVKEQGYFTGYAVVNPNELLTVQTEVTVELLDAAGRVIGTPRIVSLPPGGQFTELVETELNSGYVRIRASLPVVAVGSIGRDKRVLANLPGKP